MRALPPTATAALALLLPLGLPAAPARAAEDAKLNFTDNASKIFQARCNTCHNADKASGGLNLTTFASMMEGGGSGSAIEPGDPDNSWLFLLVSHQETPHMPPNAPRIPDEELETLRSWIEAGAPESAGSVVNVQKKPKMEFTLDPSAIGKPSGEPAMPQGLPTEPVLVNDRPGAILALAASPWAPLVAVGQHKQVLLYDTQHQYLRAVLPFPEGDVHVVKFTRDGDLLIAGGGRGGQSGRVIVWDVKTGARIIEAGQEYDLVLGADLSPDRSLVALGGPSKVLRVYSTADDSLVYEQKKHTDWVTSVSFSPDGVLLASGDRNGGTLVWEARTGREFYTLAGHGARVTDLDWRLDSNVLASASEDASVKTWDMFTGNQIKTWSAHGGGTTSARFAKDGRLVTSGRDRVARLWDQDGKELKAYGGFEDLALQAALGHDDATVVAGSFDGVVRLFKADDATPLGDLRANPLTVASRLEQLRPEAEAAQARADAATAELEPLSQAAASAAEALAAADTQFKVAEAAAAQAAAATTQAEAAATESTTAHQAALDAFRQAAEADAKALESLASASRAAADAASSTRSLAEQAAAAPGDPAARQSAEQAMADRSTATQAVVPALAAVIASADAIKAARSPLAEASAKRQAADAALAAAKAASQAAADAVAPLQVALDQATAAKAAADAALAAKAPAADALVAQAESYRIRLDALLAELDARQPEPAAAASINEE
ncbi:c-type cytochrome domain-containing protein [Tautonia plasticadhaerens]|uniref:Chromosome partition protein Smc n=1 Tax=Tautonia plasticadhaerens TaxID=2527974 RepID=A0A518HAZ6_9BACT|nr:c-type cytochrome domain-containing protein [Tautonia plasticadhaerens]QDV38035.1 Chromosome partition protein Smc [Tautonia plasticadhaerens]